MAYTLEINGTDWELDREWTLETYMKLLRFDVNFSLTWPQMIATASGAPTELVALIPEEVQAQAITVIQANLEPTWSEFKPNIGALHFMNLDKLTIGQFVDLEVALGRGMQTNMDWMLATLYGTTRKQALQFNYETCWAALNTWYAKRQEILASYEDLFSGSGDDGSDGPSEDPAHAWFDMLMTLADEKFLNLQYVVDRPVWEALNFLAWRADQARKAELELKKQQMLNRKWLTKL